MAKSKPKIAFVCQNCGAQRPRWEGKCSDCGAWNSYVEEIQSSSEGRGWNVSSTIGTASPVRTLDLDQSKVHLPRFDTGLQELNRVLGGGLPRGGFVLVGGPPGIGKSTLLLQMAGGLAKDGLKILYVSAEESFEQTSARAHRLGIKTSNISVASENEVNAIIQLVEQYKPDLLILDSIQTVFLSDLPAAPGSVSQVRESAGRFLVLAKQRGLSVVLVGHVTKDGNLAGPKVLEHMVDCVLSFEGDQSSFRLLRTLKNRFGSVMELGVFEMTSLGLREVLNPSELFFDQRAEKLLGASRFCTIEGTRPLVCEIQALTVPSPFPSPRRTSVGLDINRLHLICAVLDRHAKMNIGSQEIYLNVVGGLRLEDPSCDLALTAALLSSGMHRELPADWVWFGELGLTGEVRAVSFPDLRAQECIKLGFKALVCPEASRKGLKGVKLPENFVIHYVKDVGQIVRLISQGQRSQTDRPAPKAPAPSASAPKDFDFE